MAPPMKPDFKRRQSRTFPTNDTGTQEFVFVSGNPKKTYKPVRPASQAVQEEGQREDCARDVALGSTAGIAGGERYVCLLRCLVSPPLRNLEGEHLWSERSWWRRWRWQRRLWWTRRWPRTRRDGHCAWGAFRCACGEGLLHRRHLPQQGGVRRRCHERDASLVARHPAVGLHGFT